MYYVIYSSNLCIVLIITKNYTNAKYMRNILATLSVCFLISNALSVFAQSDGRVVGTIGDAKGQPIEAATITLLHAKDSSRLKTTVTDKTGHFTFDHVAAGKYLVSATSVGFGSVYSPVFNATVAGTRNLAPLTLASASASLQAIAVVGKRPLIE